jgi:hypothetical protein
VTKAGKELDVHEYLPTDEMLDKMGKFIENLDLMNAATDGKGSVKVYFLSSSYIFIFNIFINVFIISLEILENI